MTTESVDPGPGLTAATTGRACWHSLVQRSGERTYLRVGQQSWTFAEADTQMRSLARGLRSLGVGAGTRLAVGLENTADVVFSHLAVAELGAVMVALVPGLGAAELRYQIDHSEAEVLLLDGRVAEAVLSDPVSPGNGEETGAVRAVVTRPESAERVRGAAVTTFEQLYAHAPLDHAELDGYGPLSPSLLLYTSGSTAAPKGVVLPAAAVADVGRDFAGQFGVTGEDIFLLPFTAAHGVGGLVVPGLVLASGCALVLEPGFSPSRFWSRVAATGATVTLLFPAQMQLLQRFGADPGRGESSLRLVITHVYDQAFRDRFGVEVATVWATTEAASHGTGSEQGYAGGRPDGYVGYPFRGTELQIRDSSGAVLPTGEVGEIFVRHPRMMLGYLRDPGATAAVIQGDWAASGDLGSLQPDGALIFHGRLKNMVKRSGENISPEQVENTLREHDSVVEAVVFGVPDPVRTEELAAVVQVRSNVDPGTLSGFVAERLARWKAPRYVIVTDGDLPRLPNGKVNKVRVRDGFDIESAWDRERGAAVARSRAS